MAVEPVVVPQGPRSVGKSTTLHEIAREHAVSIVDLDRPELREAVAADPAAFVAGSAPVCIDEFQKVRAEREVAILDDEVACAVQRAFREG